MQFHNLRLRGRNRSRKPRATGTPARGTAGVRYLNPYPTRAPARPQRDLTGQVKAVGQRGRAPDPCRPRPGRRVVTAALCWFALAFPARAEEAAASLYVRTDSDTTTVISPRLRVAADVLESTNLSLTYAVDVWSSASIDIRTSATPRVIEEQRDELDVGVTQLLDEYTLSGTYRYSVENDYTSHGGSANLSRDFNDRATTLAAGLSFSADEVGRAGDPDFEKALTTMGARVSFTQVLDPKSLVQLNYDLSLVNGFQSSPYRRVPFTQGVPCNDTDAVCYQERVPEGRSRHAFAVRARRAFGDFSVGLDYRFYIDSWSLSSHTAMGQVAWVPTDVDVVTLRYRFYTQGATDFYRSSYEGLAVIPDYRTWDRELSPLVSHRAGLDGTHGFEFGDGDVRIDASVSTGITRYDYSDFPALRGVTAYELTFALGTEL